MLLFSLIDKNHNFIRLLQSSKPDLAVASRFPRCAISELRVLCWSWDPVKPTASAVANAWHKVVDFKLKSRGFAIGTFDNDMINTPEQAFKIIVFFKTVDNALMQLKEGFSGQQLLASTFSILFPNRLARATNEEIAKNQTTC